MSLACKLWYLIVVGGLEQASPTNAIFFFIIKVKAHWKEILTQCLKKIKCKKTRINDLSIVYRGKNKHSQIRANAGSRCWKNGFILRGRLKQCVVMDVHQRCLQTWGIDNCQTFKRRVHLCSYGKKAILSYMKAWLKEVWAPLNLWNILFQNESIENTKSGTQIWNHQSPTP
jgi:hypothetical protein